MKSRTICAGLCFLIALSSLGAQSPQDRQHAAAAALKSQMSREGQDCVGAVTTYDNRQSMATVEETTKNDFDTFYKNLETLLRTSPTNLQKLQASQEQWTQYVAKACDAIDSLYSGGTIRPSGVVGCRVRLTRSCMKDLDALYATVLHN